MRRISLAIVLALATAGCGSSEEAAPPPGRGRGPFSGGAAEPAPTPSAPAASPSSARRSRDPAPFGGGTGAPIGSSGSLTQTTEVTTPGAPADAPERDLGADLATAIGSPASCIDVETARSLHGHLSIRVTATVMPTGSITRASASGSSLPTAALDCVEARALAAHLRPPIEGAPRSVTATLAYDVATTEDTTTTTTPDIPTPRGAVAPGIVTPAVGPDGPIAGNVAPSSTLPATGPAGRPEGTVAPDIVLPARAGD